MPPIEQHPLSIRQRPVQKAQSEKNTATVESQNTNLIERANSSSPKRAMETASVSHDEEHQHAVISFADGAKVRKNLETLAEKLENVSNQRKNFINEVANAINATSDGSNSKYASFETGDGHIVTIRLANHNATVSNFDYKGELDGISIVVSPQKSRKQRRFNGKCHICCLKLASNGQKRKEVTLVTS